MKKIILMLVTLVLLAFGGQAALGCSCVVESKPEHIDYQQWQKDFRGAAFRGRVLKIETDEARLLSKVTFAVETYWRGVDTAEVVVLTPSQSAMCGVTYAEGQKYTVIIDQEGGILRNYICPDIKYAANADKYLKALGQGKSPAAAGAARKFDEFGNINCEYELARLDAFAVQLQNEPTSTGYIIIYGGQKGKRNEAKARLARMKYYLEHSRGLKAGSVIAVDGGYRETLMGELWIARAGENAPKASPTVAAKKVRLKGTAKVRGYNCGDQM
jgi:hypothetical protein